MTAYQWLARRLPTPVAALVAGLWYAALIALVVLLAELPAGRFVYDSL